MLGLRVSPSQAAALGLGVAEQQELPLLNTYYVPGAFQMIDTYYFRSP